MVHMILVRLTSGSYPWWSILGLGSSLVSRFSVEVKGWYLEEVVCQKALQGYNNTRMTLVNAGPNYYF